MSWKLVYYLLEFYLFAVSGALAYLSARAWFDPAVAGRKSSSHRLMGRWANLARCLGFTAIAVAAFTAAVYEGTGLVQFDGLVRIARIVGFLIAVGLLPRDLRMSKTVLIASAAFIVGEITLDWQGAATHIGQHGVVGTVFLSFAISLLAIAFKGAVVRVRLVDRLVIAFAIFSMLLAGLVGLLFLVLEINIGLGSEQANTIIANGDKPLIITLATVLVTSAVIGFFLARDLSAPMTRLGRALKAIGEGELDYRVQLRDGGDDEIHDLAREVNRMAQKLKSAESVRAEFFSFVSHELRSPLTAIRGFVETLQAEPNFGDEDRREIYDIIHEESDRLLRMIGELLDISRIQAGRPLTLIKQRFEVGRHLERVAEIMRGHTQRHKLKVVRAQEPVWLEADPDKFDQILINLVSNAIKYSPDGGDVELALRETVDAVEIAIKDPGVGMTAAQTQHIFDKYYRVSDEGHQDRLARVEGAGIGLYLTRALVEAHGGRVQVDSELGSGSTFTVTIPRLAAATDDHRPNGDDRRDRGTHASPLDLTLPADKLQRQVEAAIPTD